MTKHPHIIPLEKGYDYLLMTPFIDRTLSDKLKRRNRQRRPDNNTLLKSLLDFAGCARLHSQSKRHSPRHHTPIASFSTEHLSCSTSIALDLGNTMKRGILERPTPCQPSKFAFPHLFPSYFKLRKRRKTILMGDYRVLKFRHSASTRHTQDY